ncbi:methyltransferase domain-containing protein [Nibrella saemangeumensis]|uniref:Methyltransferase domain-containing protein n=1 Tax=Nibrella saemangeumensis TaxID=1084526 RepID=A0ABP8N559_9BACT
MANQPATNRAQMPTAPNPVLERRTVENSNRNLLKYLKPGLSVLDVGCGSGAITRGIAEKTGPTGRVLGIDLSESLLAQALQNAADIPQLRFQQADIYSFDTDERFDLITCTRTLQWLAHPQEALARMKQLLKPGGHLAVLDYNHEKIQWTPEPPEAMQKFYAAFLTWRSDAGFDNAIADHLAGLMRNIGLANIHIDPQFETTHKEDPAFAVAGRLWSEVAEIRGPQLVEAGYITEAERLEAIRTYDDWLATVGESMQVYLLAVEAQV